MNQDRFLVCQKCGVNEERKETGRQNASYAEKKLEQKLYSRGRLGK